MRDEYWGGKLAFTVEWLGTLVLALVAATTDGTASHFAAIGCGAFAVSAFANRMQH